jgi:sulfur carrier protein ThiS
MSSIKVYKGYPNTATVAPLPAARDWMDKSHDKHAYMCFPMALTNRLGWGISFPEDIVFIWDGIDDTTPDHVKVLKGQEWANSKRGNATLSFETGLIFKTDPDVTLLTMPVPNQFIAGTQCFTTLISTSFYMPPLPIAWKLTEANKEITIPAGTPVAALLPISLGHLENDYVMELNKEILDNSYWQELQKYGDAAQAKNAIGDWSKMYRDAVDYKGDKVGAHETKSIKLKTVTCPFTGQTYEVEDDSVEPNE